MSVLVEIPARGGKACRLKAGEAVKIINTHGEQVVDTWAYNADDTHEYMSMSATRAYNLNMRPVLGKPLLTDKRRPILVFEQDTSHGKHDTLMAACDNERYGLLGCTAYHDNCADNLRASMQEFGINVAHIPQPLNLYMNIPWTDAGELEFAAPPPMPGCYVVLRAVMDCYVAFSACPQDILPINGTVGKPVEAHFEVLSAA